MKVTTGLYAFVDDSRIVDVPDAEWNDAKTTAERLELVYHYGQNDFQPQGVPSLTAGDVVIVDGDIWIIAMIGFHKLSIATLVMYAGAKQELRWKMREILKVA